MSPTEKVSDVVSQLEAVIAGIETSTPRGCDDGCFYDFNGRVLRRKRHSENCEVRHVARVRSEIARTVDRMLDAAANSGYSLGSLAAPPGGPGLPQYWRENE